MADSVFYLGRQDKPRHRVIIPCDQMDAINDYGSFSERHGVEAFAYVAGRQTKKETYVTKFEIPKTRNVVVVRYGFTDIIGITNAYNAKRNIHAYDILMYVFDGSKLVRSTFAQVLNRDVHVFGSPDQCSYTDIFREKAEKNLADGENIVGVFHTHLPPEEKTTPSATDVSSSLEMIQDGIRSGFRPYIFLEFISSVPETAIFGFVHGHSKHLIKPGQRKKAMEKTIDSWIAREYENIRFKQC